MKIGIVYYSRTGNTHAAATMLAEKIKTKTVQADLIEIKTMKRPGFFTAGRAAMKQKDLALQNHGTDLGLYDAFIIGAPVWAWNPAPVIKTYFSHATNFQGKKAAIYLTCGGKPEEASSPVEKIRQNLENIGLQVVKDTLVLQMKKATIIAGQDNIDPFIKQIKTRQKKQKKETSPKETGEQSTT